MCQKIKEPATGGKVKSEGTEFRVRRRRDPCACQVSTKETGFGKKVRRTERRVGWK